MPDNQFTEPFICTEILKANHDEKLDELSLMEKIPNFICMNANVPKMRSVNS